LETLGCGFTGAFLAGEDFDFSIGVKGRWFKGNLGAVDSDLQKFCNY